MNITRHFILMLILFCCASFVSCDSGGDDETVPSTPLSEKTITGTAAAGAPITGTVRVKGSLGLWVKTDIQADGTFSLDVSGLTAPYILKAEGTVNGETLSLYSAGVEEGAINITPITDFILLHAIGGESEMAYDTFDGSAFDAQTLNDAKDLVYMQLAPLLSALNIPDDIDLITTPFSADSTGLDLALESLNISVNGTVVTVTNLVTGSSFTDDIASSLDDTNGLPDEDTDQIVQLLSTADLTTILDDNEAINAVFDILEALFAESRPTDISEMAEFSEHMALDFFESGGTANQVLYNFVTYEDSIAVGFNMTAYILSSLDLSGTDYTKGYTIRIDYKAPDGLESQETKMVYDGVKWLWWGNRNWVNLKMTASADMHVDLDEKTFITGIRIIIGDYHGYANSRGVQSAVITGPQIPSPGIILYNAYPLDDSFLILYLDNYSVQISDDSVIAAISDNSEYTVSLYEETAGAIEYYPSAYTPLSTGTVKLAKAPVTNAGLDSSYFAALISPTSQDIDDLNFGGKTTLSWTLPQNTLLRHVSMSWSSGDVVYRLSSEPGVTITSITFDTTGMPQPDGKIHISIGLYDKYGRIFSSHWEYD